MTVLVVAWLLVQLVGYVIAMVAIVAAVAIVVLAPPFFAGRYLWLRLR